jgi:hypothetical protein
MRRLVAGLAVFSLSAVAHAQGVADLFRSVTNALQSGRTQQAPQQQQGATAVLGVRGMDQADAVATAPAANSDYLLMEGWAAMPSEAEAVAGRKGLSRHPAVLGRAEPVNDSPR